MATFQDFLANQGSSSVQPVQTDFQKFLANQGTQTQTVTAPAPVQQQKPFLERSGFVQSILSPAINLGQDIAQVFFPEVKQAQQARQQLQDMAIRVQNSSIPDARKKELIDSISTVPTIQTRNTKQMIGDVIGTALFVTPFPEISGVAKLGTPLAQQVARGAIIGGTFGATSALSNDEDLGGFLKSAAIGAGFGAVAEPLTVKLVDLVSKGAGAISTKAKSYFTDVVDSPSFLKSVGSRLQNDYGQEGRMIADKLYAADRNSLMRTGSQVDELANSGLFNLNKEQGTRLVDALEGRVSPAQLTPEERAVFEAAHAMRTSIAGEASDVGLKVRYSGKGLSFEQANEKLASGELSKIDLKAAKLGANGIKEIPFKPRENYYPHFVPSVEKLEQGPMREAVIDNAVHIGAFKTPEAATEALDSYISLAKTRSGGEYWAKYLVKSGQAENETEALGKTLRFFKPSRLNRSGTLEKARELNIPFWNPDPKSALPTYAFNSLKRLEEVKQFGDKFQRIDYLLGKIAKAEGAEVATEARQLVNVVRGAIEKSPKAERVSLFLRTLQTPKLAFATISNIGQSLNTLLSTDAPSTLKGIMLAFKDEGVERALQSGATLESVMRESAQGLSESGFGTKLLKYTGFSSVEKFNRTVAANAGAEYATRTLDKLVKNPTNRILEAQLRELGVNVPEAVARKALTPEEVLMAAQRVAEIAQFRSRAIDLPMFMASPTGKLMFQFKSFAYNQTKFLKNEFVNQWERGNYGKLVRDIVVLGTVFPVVGEGIADIKSLLTGSKRPTDGFDRYLNDLLSVGGFGIVTDALNAASYGKLAEAILGPSISTGTDLTERAVRILKKPNITDSDAKFLLRQTGFGTTLANYLFPSSQKDQKTFIDTLIENFGD